MFSIVNSKASVLGSLNDIQRKKVDSTENRTENSNRETEQSTEQKTESCEQKIRCISAIAQGGATDEKFIYRENKSNESLLL